MSVEGSCVQSRFADNRLASTSRPARGEEDHSDRTPPLEHLPVSPPVMDPGSGVGPILILRPAPPEVQSII